MITMQEKEIAVLGMLERQRLAKRSEIRRLLGQDDGCEDIIRSLVMADSIRPVELGEMCFVITSEGARRLKELRSMARAVQQPAGVQVPPV